MTDSTAPTTTPVVVATACVAVSTTAPTVLCTVCTILRARLGAFLVFPVFLAAFLGLAFTLVALPRRVDFNFRIGLRAAFRAGFRARDDLFLLLAFFRDFFLAMIGSPYVADMI